MNKATTSNATVDLILSRLPDKPLISPREIADAIGFQTTKAITNAMEEGRIEGVKLGTYWIARDEAVRFIKSLGV